MYVTALPQEITIVAMVVLMIVGISTIALCVSAFSFWIWMFIDCLKRPIEKFPNKNQNDRTYWTVLIFTTFLIGAILYFLIVKNKT